MLSDFFPSHRPQAVSFLARRAPGQTCRQPARSRTTQGQPKYKFLSSGAKKAKQKGVHPGAWHARSTLAPGRCWVPYHHARHAGQRPSMSRLSKRAPAAWGHAAERDDEGDRQGKWSVHGTAKAGWCRFVLTEKYRWLAAGDWFAGWLLVTDLL